jgi:hypothetical protein
LIRAAEWRVEKRDEEGDIRSFNLDTSFVPTAEAFQRFSQEIGKAPRSLVRIRRLELSEPRLSIDGRASFASFFDLVLALDRNPACRVSIPKVDGYLEARFWSDVLRTLEGEFGLPPHSISVEIGIESLGGVMEAEEILFELKEQAASLRYDPRGVLAYVLALESAAPVPPTENLGATPWANSATREHFAHLLGIAERRGVKLETHQRPVDPERAEPFSLEVARERLDFAFGFLKGWFSGEESSDGKDWTDLDLARALVWTAIQSGYLREEFYDAWKAGLGLQPFELGSPSEAALRALEPLLLTAVFPESSMVSAFSVLLEIDKNAKR